MGSDLPLILRRSSQFLNCLSLLWKSRMRSPTHYKLRECLWLASSFVNYLVPFPSFGGCSLDCFTSCKPRIPTCYILPKSCHQVLLDLTAEREMDISFNSSQLSSLDRTAWFLSIGMGIVGFCILITSGGRPLGTLLGRIQS